MDKKIRIRFMVICKIGKLQKLSVDFLQNGHRFLQNSWRGLSYENQDYGRATPLSREFNNKLPGRKKKEDN